jgi:ribulose kinase
MAYALGLDFGTNSVRTLVVDVENGNKLGIGRTRIRSLPGNRFTNYLTRLDAPPIKPGPQVKRARL